MTHEHKNAKMKVKMKMQVTHIMAKDELITAGDKVLDATSKLSGNTGPSVIPTKAVIPQPTWKEGLNHIHRWNEMANVLLSEYPE
jgi:hypothetical protein